MDAPILLRGHTPPRLTGMIVPFMTSGGPATWPARENLSVIHDGRGFMPSPVYDIPSTVPYGDHDLALRVGGSTTDLSRRKILAYTDSQGLLVRWRKPPPMRRCA